ncbi:MAG: division/cell wall cluster transcriptional repressor MraZ [Alphaproteobacteria bacterium]|nr:division/cell wall cluster transcriptional repressor MraZ [Alphaproteobacteria bacterium]
MDRFVSTFTNKLDAKGRVSVPSPFRSVLARDGFGKIFCYPSLNNEALDAGGEGLICQAQTLLETLNPYSNERDHLSIALFGVSETLKIDNDGRIILSDRLKTHTGITDQVTFVGLGEKFQIWEPSRFEAQLNTGRALLREMKKALSRSGTALLLDKGSS